MAKQKEHDVSIVYTDEYFKILEQRKQLEKQLLDLNSSLKQEVKKTLLLCRNCNLATPLNKAEYIQTYFYIRPYSCIGGDYNVPSEANWVCPGCNFRHRFEDNEDSYKTMANPMHLPELVSLKYNFGKIIDDYR